MYSYLKITKNYPISPDARAFMIHGTKGHNLLEVFEDEYSLVEEKLEHQGVTGIMDVLEVEGGKNTLVDTKTSGSYVVAKALGIYYDREETGEVYKSGKKKGQPKTRKIMRQSGERIDKWSWEMQLNKYRMGLEETGFRIDEMRIMCVVRDGGTHIAKSRGIFRNIYYIPIERLDDDVVNVYYKQKAEDLAKALEQGYWDIPCTNRENWDGVRCTRFCEVAHHCPIGKYLMEKKQEDIKMPIKGLTETVQLPILGNVRLGEKQTNEEGKEYPVELDYFKLDPATPIEEERDRLIAQFTEEYGPEPKRIDILLLSDEDEITFPQHYMRFLKRALRCKGDGEAAECPSKGDAKGLEIIEEDGSGFKVKCLGDGSQNADRKQCPYYQKNKCSKIATLSFVIRGIEEAGIWRMTTTSVSSIRKINSGMLLTRMHGGRVNMIPLYLERRPQQMVHDGVTRTHYIVHLMPAVSPHKIQYYGSLEANQVLLQLPGVSEDREVPVFQETPDLNAGVIDAEFEGVDSEKEEKTETEKTDGGKEPESAEETPPPEKGETSGGEKGNAVTVEKLADELAGKIMGSKVVKESDMKIVSLSSADVIEFGKSMYKHEAMMLYNFKKANESDKGFKELLNAFLTFMND